VIERESERQKDQEFPGIEKHLDNPVLPFNAVYSDHSYLTIPIERGCREKPSSTAKTIQHSGDYKSSTQKMAGLSYLEADADAFLYLSNDPSMCFADCCVGMCLET